MTLGKLARYVCALSLFAACLAGQTVSSSIVGTVLDPANAVVPNASVTVTARDTGSVRSVVTDGSGIFRILDVTPGLYSLSVKATGFKGYTQTNLTVEANQTR